MLNPKDYFKTVRRPYPPLFSSIIMSGYRNPEVFKEYLNKPYCMTDLIISDASWYYSIPDFEAGKKLAFESWSHTEKLNKIKELFKKRESSFTKAARKDFITWSQEYESYMPALTLVFALDSAVADQVRSLLSKKLDSKAVERLMSDLNIPLEDNFYKKEEYDLITTKDLRAHVKEYEWIKSRYGEVKPYTLAEAKKKRDEIDKNKFLGDWNKQKARVKKSIVYAKQLIPASVCVVIDLMQFIVYYRTQRTDIMNRSQYLHAPQLHHLAAEKKITYEELLHCTKEELLNEIPSRKVLQSRIKDYAVILEDSEIYCVSGKDSDKIRRMFAEKVNDITEVKGNIACPGYAKGKVKLIKGTADFMDFKIGQILVASMTNPHMVPIMKKAAAFVTDEGGITCHAAIMSREMQKPCVIGTKFATKVFKNGDFVEVDANKGIVRKLK